MSDPDSRSVHRPPNRPNPLLLAQRHGATPIPPSLQAKMAAVCLTLLFSIFTDFYFFSLQIEHIMA